MNVRTICWFLLGRRAAIERMAACPRAVWVGLLFVLSAGLAREYDGEDLLAEPYHAVLPLVASLGTSLLLYALLSLVARCWHRPGQWWLGYTRFLGLYWMTAPLAWLYAIPVERFLPPLEATVANLYLLAGVSLWRVLLMIRVTSVLLSARWWAAIMVVMLFADSVALLAIGLIPHPVMTIMGGVRLTPSEAVIANTSCAVQVWGMLLMPIWFFGTLDAAIFRRLRWPNWRRIGEDENDPIRSGGEYRCVERSAWIAGWALLAAGVALLPVGQGEQQRRTEAEGLLRSGEVTAAVRFMSQFDRGAFPPHWDPPPRLGYGELEPPLIDVLEALLANNAPQWLWEAYQAKLALAFEGKWYDTLVSADEPAEFERWLAVLEAMPRQRRFILEWRGVLESYYRHHISDGEQAERFRSWMNRNGAEVPLRKRDSVDQRPAVP